MNPAIKRLIEGIPTLDSYSPVLGEIEAILGNPQSTLSDVGEVIEKDPALTARLLKLANSGFFGFPNRLETVPEALSLIGIQQVEDLICASTVVEIFDGISADSVNMQSFWKHSMACGVAARLLAQDQRMPKTEKFFVLGLLHDVGRLALYSRSPVEVKKIFALYGGKTMMLREAEEQVLGFDHTEIAEQLLINWNFPPNLINAVRYHHNPIGSGAFQKEASLIHMADYTVNAMQLGSSGERNVPPLNIKAWERLSLTTDSFESLMASVDSQIEIVEQTFLTKASAS